MRRDPNSETSASPLARVRQLKPLALEQSALKLAEFAFNLLLLPLVSVLTLKSLNEVGRQEYVIAGATLNDCIVWALSLNERLV